MIRLLPTRNCAADHGGFFQRSGRHAIGSACVLSGFGYSSCELSGTCDVGTLSRDVNRSGRETTAHSLWAVAAFKPLACAGIVLVQYGIRFLSGVITHQTV
jgi:hypothetical protein